MLRAYKAPITVTVMLLLLIGGGFWWKAHHHLQPRMVYTSQGFGGFAPAVRKSAKEDPLWPINQAYKAGKYKDAEAAAQRFIDANAKSSDVVLRKKSVEVRNILAFSAARRKDLKTARERFAVLEVEASKLPDKGKPESLPGQFEPTLAEQGAYQHAVCTAALGEKKAAETEYIKFMHDYPESFLMNGVVQRLQRLNGGNLPPEASKAFAEAQTVAAEREKERRKEDSLCGPECLAELLRRRGEKADVHTLANEMKTSDHGTSLQSLADCAKKHGYTPEGLQLTRKGLSKQPLPAIALTGEHYVIVESINLFGVTIWDPAGSPTGKPAPRHYSPSEWDKIWQGITLVFRPKNG